MKPTRKHPTAGNVLFLMGWLAFGVRCTAPATEVPVSAALPSSPIAPADPTTVRVLGLVGTGGMDPVPAHVTGRVRQLFFTGGEYVHRGQLLAKLYSRSYVLAPHDGFLGPALVSEGQRLAPATPVTTISRRRHLVVALTLPGRAWGRVGAGDSVRVWVASRPDRVVSGVVAALPPSAPGRAFPVEINLALRAPFRSGERAYVELRDTRRTRPPASAMPVTVEARPRR